MAQLAGTQTIDRGLRRNLEELATNLWLGRPANKEKAGNFRAIFLAIDLTDIPAGTTFGVLHTLSEVPLGYLVVGTATTEVIPLAPGTGTETAWTSTRLYLKAPADTNKTVVIMVWGTDSISE